MAIVQDIFCLTVHEKACSNKTHKTCLHLFQQELKEACKSFEKVLVQNIHFGLSPSLTSALQSIPRWRLVQAGIFLFLIFKNNFYKIYFQALPHVMHCTAALLSNRVKDLQNLGAAETKVLKLNAHND